jgi:hypothetical protein
METAWPLSRRFSPPYRGGGGSTARVAPFDAAAAARAWQGKRASVRGGGLGMGFFRSEVETVLKMVGIAGLITMIILPVAWGYEQRKQARTWHNVACAYRMKEVARQAPMIATLPYRHDACVTLEQLGLDLDLPR